MTLYNVTNPLDVPALQYDLEVTVDTVGSACASSVRAAIIDMPTRCCVRMCVVCVAVRVFVCLCAIDFPHVALNARPSVSPCSHTHPSIHAYILTH